jgi:hypothetical protein
VKRGRWWYDRRPSDFFFSAPPKREKAEGKSAPRLVGGAKVVYGVAGLGLGGRLMPRTGSGPASTRLGNAWVRIYEKANNTSRKGPVTSKAEV